MLIDTNQSITETEDAQDFLKATASDLPLTDDEKIDIVARRVLERYKDAFLELAKN